MTRILLSVLAASAALAIPFLPTQVEAHNHNLQAGSPQILIADASAALPTPPSNQAQAPWILYLLAAGGSTSILLIATAFLFRRVVSTNMVHIVQKGKETVPYGSNLPEGNVYYEIPTWVPKLGVSVVKLPVNNFDLSLENYEAYDEDRVPFLVDVTAFFRICDPSVAAQRITNIQELKHQLGLVVQGAVRKVLASDKIDNIMTQRSTFGESFSNEVREQLAEWGVHSIRNMELMDIRDSHKSEVIAKIMAKKISEIERDSRITVAENKRLATVSEVENKRQADISAVDAEREVQLSREQAAQQVGEMAAAKEQSVGIAQEQSKQQILAQQAITKEKDMAVARVQEVRVAEIERDTALVIADKAKKVAEVDKETALVKATQEQQTMVLVAEGKLEAEKKNAEAIQATGIAKAEAEKALQLAPVSAQIALAQEIGGNPSYQNYLALIEGMKAYIAVGSEQAKSLQNAEVKVIANGGTAPEGITKVMDVFSSKGGTELAAAIEAFTQSDIGSQILNRISRPS